MSERRRTWVGRHKVLTVLIALVLVIAIGVGVPYLRVALATNGRIHTLAAQPDAPVAIVFGAGVTNGQPSPYLRARLQGAKELYEAGKVRAILVSGDNATKEYDEPTAMHDWLVDNGVPDKVIALDYAGFSTNDTCDRAHDIFGITKAVAVTQDYHVRRAVFTCARAGIETTGLGVPAIGGTIERYKLREFIATVNAGWGSALKKRATVMGPKEDSVTKILSENPDPPPTP